MAVLTAEMVTRGAWVKVTGLVPGEQTVLQFVPEDEVDHSDHKLPPDSLLGSALMGSQVGDKVSLGALDDEVELEVLDVGVLR